MVAICTVNNIAARNEVNHQPVPSLMMPSARSHDRSQEKSLRDTFPVLPLWIVLGRDHILHSKMGQTQNSCFYDLVEFKMSCKNELTSVSGVYLRLFALLGRHCVWANFSVLTWHVFHPLIDVSEIVEPLKRLPKLFIKTCPSFLFSSSRVSFTCQSFTMLISCLYSQCLFKVFSLCNYFGAFMILKCICVCFK